MLPAAHGDTRRRTQVTRVRARLIFAAASGNSYLPFRTRPMHAMLAFRHLGHMRKHLRRFLSHSPAGAARALWRFAVGVLRDFRANQGLLLAGAVAYYALLSLVPMLILVVIALSHFMDAQRIIATISEYLQFIVP